jgi:hypothetical protein
MYSGCKKKKKIASLICYTILENLLEEEKENLDQKIERLGLKVYWFKIKQQINLWVEMTWKSFG